MKHFLIALILGAVSSGASAELLSTDWQTASDDLITQDTVTGLLWLDVSETYGTPFDTVSAEFGTGGQFEGFRYATDAEVENLWSNFGIDLPAGAPTSVNNWDAGVETAAGLLGNTWNTYAWWDYPFGVSGITATVNGTGHHAMGAYQTDWGSTTYETVGTITLSDSLSNIQPYGSYLVSGATVPIPAAVWLFGSALGLLGWMRRKTS